MHLLRRGSDTGSRWLADSRGRSAITEFVVWSAWWLALMLFVLLAAVGMRRAVRAFGVAAAALDWRVPEVAQNMAMFGSGVASLGAHRAAGPDDLVAHVNGRLRPRVQPVDRCAPTEGRTMVEYMSAV
jgi:hypothetical protein